MIEKLEGEGSIWDTIKREKLSTFTSNNKTEKVILNNKTVQIKHERKLMNRLLVASRTRPDIDLPKYLGMYEFFVVPLSLFTPDGSLYYPKDKATIAAELRNFQHENESESTEYDCSSNTRKVIIIDGMAIVNKINISSSQISNWVKNKTDDYDEFRVVFDRYDPKSLKNNTRSNRTKGLSAVYYKVSDTTRISHLSTKEFLSSIKTKSELTEYLGKKLAECTSKEYVVVYGNTLITNIGNLDEQLYNYNQEEADTGIVLHAIDVTKRDPFTDLVVLCSDTDVLLILLHYFEKISSSTIFETADHKYILHQIYENLGPVFCKALLGFHALSGCDQTGKFPGYSKKSCWDVFLTLPSNVLQALTHLGSSDTPPVVDIKSLLMCKI